LLGGIQAQAFTFIEVVCGQLGNCRAAVAGAQALVGQEGGFGLTVLLDTLTPAEALLVEGLETLGGLGPNQLLA
jgi:hypothetical protein